MPRQGNLSQKSYVSKAEMGHYIGRAGHSAPPRYFQEETPAPRGRCS